MGNSCGTRERPVTHTPGDRGGAREGDVIERSASEKQRERERERERLYETATERV